MSADEKKAEKAGDDVVAETDDVSSQDSESPDGAEIGDRAGELESKPETGRRVPRIGRRGMAAIVLAVALVVSAGAAGWLYYNQYRLDKQTDTAAAGSALEAAKTGTVALLSYSPETLDDDFATAKALLTGDFLSYYTDFTEKVVAPAAMQKSVETTANVVQGAVSEIQPNSAEVLLFINQNTVSNENPDGAFAASSVKVGLEKIDGTWLIASFDPV